MTSRARATATTSGASARRTAAAPDVVEPPMHHNEVALVGRLTAVADESPLPSGDLVVGFRLVVERPVAERAPGPHAGTVDVLDCRALRPGVRRTLRGLRQGDVIAVGGSLRRRFFRGAGGLSSRYEVEVGELRRLYRPG